MKRLLSVFTVILSISLTACDAVKDRVLSILFKGETITQTPPQIPEIIDFPTDAEIQNKISENLQYIHNTISEKDGQTTYYFYRQKDECTPYPYRQTDDKNQAEIKRIILGTTIEGYCAIQDYYINGEKNSEPFIERDTQFCSVYDYSRITDSLITVHYDERQNITQFSYTDIENKENYRFVYHNGKKLLLLKYNIAQSPLYTKTEMFFSHDKVPNHSTLTTIDITNFNQKKIIKSTQFYYDKKTIPAYIQQVDYIHHTITVWENPHNDTATLYKENQLTKGIDDDSQKYKEEQMQQAVKRIETDITLRQKQIN